MSINKLFAIYFSGTGNTQYAVERFCDAIKTAGIDSSAMSIEDCRSFKDGIAAADTVLIGYPIYGSDMPEIMKEFLNQNAGCFSGKQIIILITQLIFSGDGAALAVRQLKKHGAECKILSAIHINMPSNISDRTIFKIKNGDENRKKIAKANDKIETSVNKILSGKKIRNGRRFYSWFVGFFAQRLWAKLFLEQKLKAALKIDKNLCKKCVKCVSCCPVKNIKMTGQSAVPMGHCSTCYRCVNLCPAKAISLFSKKKPKEQYKGIR